jgi:hypothetical protein
VREMFSRLPVYLRNGCNESTVETTYSIIVLLWRLNISYKG